MLKILIYTALFLALAWVGLTYGLCLIGEKIDKSKLKKKKG